MAKLDLGSVPIYDPYPVPVSGQYILVLCTGHGLLCKMYERGRSGWPVTIQDFCGLWSCFSVHRGSGPGMPTCCPGWNAVSAACCIPQHKIARASDDCCMLFLLCDADIFL